MGSLQLDLARIQPGFSNPVYSSQEVFRRCLSAMSRPGTLIEVAHDAEVPEPLTPAAGALALTLLDHDTTVWLSPSLQCEEVITFLRFHTGCTVTDEPMKAAFGFVHSPAELPPFEAFALGSEEFPQDSITLVLQSHGLASGIGWPLSGPGIHRSNLLRAAGYGADFAGMWAANHRRFPCGADVIFASANLLCGLPRTTMIGS